jgi:TRAP-type C4-dicarboxylate transport system permease small subunit
LQAIQGRRSRNGLSSKADLFLDSNDHIMDGKGPMKKVVFVLDQSIQLASRFGGGFGAALIVGISVIITVNSFSRYVLGQPLLFVDEYSQYMLVALVYLGMGFTLRAGKHVSADLFIRKLPTRKQEVLNLLTSSFGCIVIWLMFWHSWKAFISVYNDKVVSLTPLETPLWIPHLAVSVGLTLFLLDMFAELGHGLKRLVARKKP